MYKKPSVHIACVQWISDANISHLISRARTNNLFKCYESMTNPRPRLSETWQIEICLDYGPTDIGITVIVSI